MAKKVLVIGAGIAGLSAASYLQRNGFDTEILEAHDKPGGLCTSWKRKGFTFDSCIHWLMGSGPSSNLHWIWKELGAADLEYIEWDVFSEARLADGDSFKLYTDPERLEKEMLRLAPEDGKAIRIITRGVRRTARFDMPSAWDRASSGERLAFLASFPGMIPIFLKWMKTPLYDIVSKLKGEKLRECFEILMGKETLKAFPVGLLCFMLGFMAKKSSGYPIGGSSAFARAIEKKYLGLGGNIRYGFKADRILVEDGHVRGVRGTGGEIKADIVVSAGDLHDVSERLLGGAYGNPDTDKALREYAPYPSLLYVSLGLSADYSSVTHSQTFMLKKPLVLEGGALRRDKLGVRFFSFDPTMAPAGKTSAVVMIETSNDAYWTGLKGSDPAKYEAEKRTAADTVISGLEEAFPGISGKVEVVDVATPASFIRYTNNWRGSYEGWLPVNGASPFKKMERTFRGLEGFYLVGQWVNPGGGLPPCGIDGRDLAKRLCKADGRRFKSE
jgi:phytoene dehydrogenase-like protein